MKRTPMKRRTPLRQRRASGPDIEREERPRSFVPATVKPLHVGSYGGSTAGPAPKSEPYRDPVLLEMARGRPCLMLVPGICSHRVDTVVAAHSNLAIHGKAGARKADDVFSCWACHACHSWLDQGRAPADVKSLAFTLGHANQVMAWRQVATDAAEPERFRRAARRALERLNATPTGAAP